MLVSCGKDDKVLPYDPNNIAGNYEGTCVVDYGVKNLTVKSFPAQFLLNSANGASLIGSLGDEHTRNECGLGLVGNIQFTNFENHGHATFRVSGIPSLTYSSNIPEFILSQTESLFDVKSATLSLTCKKGGQYDVNRQEISFVYTGKIEAVGIQSNDRLSISMSYSFVLKKNR